MSKFITSTMSAAVNFRVYSKLPDSWCSSTLKDIIINGGANVADKRLLVTPRGVVTEISDEDYELIKDNYQFKKFVENGYLTVTKTNRENSKNMNGNDNSAPYTLKSLRKKNNNPALSEIK